MCGLPVADVAGGLQAVHVGHLQVHQDQVKVLGLAQPHGFVPVVGQGHAVAVALHHDLQQLQVLRHVVDRQDA